MLSFCTLFDSNYLDKGLAMYRSLQKSGCCFRLYVLAMDDLCEKILYDYAYPNVTIIPIENFVIEMDLSNIREKRPRSEFCWTCTSHLLEYVLLNYDEEICTYVDADLYFYKDPLCVIEEMKNRSVQIIEHGFGNSVFDRQCLRISGRFCVEFNTFKKDEVGMPLLAWWKEQCRKSCSISGKEEGVFGDQKYLESWVNNAGVAIVEDFGAGVAPWNIQQYKLVGKDSDKYVLWHKRFKKKTELVFYHFHSIEYITNREVKVPIYNLYWGVDDRLVKELYIPYLDLLESIKMELKNKYDFYPILYKHPAFEDSSNELSAPKKDLKFYCNKIVTENKKVLFEKLYIKVNGLIRKKIQGKKDVLKF